MPASVAASAATDAVSRSTATTGWPRARHSIAWRPLPQARSSTIPPAAMRCTCRATNGDGAGAPQLTRTDSACDAEDEARHRGGAVAVVAAAAGSLATATAAGVVATAAAAVATAAAVAPAAGANARAEGRNLAESRAEVV